MARGKKAATGDDTAATIEKTEKVLTKAKGALFAKVAKSVGGSVLSKRPGVREWIDTGNLALNHACSGRYYGGGCPNGRVIECFGPSSSGKTLVGNNLLRGVQLLDGWPVFIDAENSVDAEFAQKTSHLDPDQVIVLEDGVDTIEAAFDKIHDVVLKIRRDVDPQKPIVMVYDSIAASPSEKEFEGSALHAMEQEVNRKDNKDMPGDRAKACSKEFRRLSPVLKRMNACVFFINQVRNKIGVMFGCFSGDTLVSFADGRTVPIREVVENRLQGPVLCLDESTGKIVEAKITNWWENGSLDYEIGRAHV